ncbi:MAG: CsgG/HfaB family protein [Prevotellaceae bacterium]|jgi:hypothetical protein|nr:CsgG/HfaB family protein [Prevotellaceae bacterium]
MKTGFISFILIAATFISLPAQETKLRVAVFDPSASGSIIDDGTKIVVREIISSVFVNTGDYTIVERSLLDKIMKEQAFSNSGIVDDSQATELGKLAGANKVVLSVITQTGNRGMLSIKIIDVMSATIDKQKAKVVDYNAFLDEIEPLTRSLLGEEVEESGQSQISSTVLPYENNSQTQTSYGNNYQTQTFVAYSNNDAVRHIVNMINRQCKKPEKYRTDEDRFNSLSKSQKEPIEEFISSNSKPLIEPSPSSIKQNETVFFLRARSLRKKVGYSLFKGIKVNKVNDVLLLFLDGQLIGFGTATTGFLVTMQRGNAGGIHILSLHSSTFSALEISVDLSVKNYYLLDWDDKKNIDLVN